MPRGGRGGDIRRGGGRGGFGGGRGRQNSNNTRDRRYNVREVGVANESGDNNANANEPDQRRQQNPVIATNANVPNKANPRNRRPAANVSSNAQANKVESNEKKSNKTPLVKPEDDDPDYMYRSKLPKDPKFGHGVRYNPNDPNAKIPVTKIYVSKFGDTRIEKLKEIFSQYGPITDAVMRVEDFYSYAFISFEHHKDALKALSAETFLRSRKLDVKEAHQKHQPIPTHIDKLAAITAPDGCYIDKLNDDCLRHIFSYLNLVNRTRVEVVCKRWHRLSRAMWLVVRDLNFCRPPLCAFLRATSYDITAKQLTSYTGHNLAALTIKRFNNVDTLKVIRDNCKCLERLSLVHFNLYDVKTALPSLKNLKHLTLESCSMGDKLLVRVFKAAQSLESITCCRHLTGTQFIENLSNIHTFNMASSEVTLEYFDRFLGKNGGVLRRLSLVRCRLDEDMYEEAVEKIVKHAPNLEYLKLDRFYRATETLKLDALYKLSNLRTLSLCRNSGLTSEILLKIARNCKSLENLSLDSCPGLSAESIVALGKLPKLVSLSLCHIREGLTNQAIIDLVNTLSAPASFRHLLVANTSLSDEAFYAVLNLCGSLETLNLAFCRNVTEATLMYAEDAVTSRTQPPLNLTLNIDNTPIMTAVQQATSAGKKFNRRLILKESTMNMLSEVVSLGSLPSVGSNDLESDDTDMSGDEGGDLLNALNLVDSDDEYMYLMELGIDGLEFGYDFDPDDEVYLGHQFGAVNLESDADDSDPDYYPEF
ncbi:hypothetical protein M8J76_012132 [Diaphorina citri]|nr:hypothetical protein M8J76_012132 [Diaphorina citri]